MTDLERLKATLDALNIYYEERTQEDRGWGRPDPERGFTVVEIGDLGINQRKAGKLPYEGYGGFGYAFRFDRETGQIMEAGGYE